MTIPQNKTSLKIPLRFVLAIPFILVIVLTTSIVGYIAFMNGQKAVNNVAQQLHSEVSARIDEHLHNFLIVPIQVNQFNTISMQQGWLDPKDIKKTQDYFLEQVKTHKTITSVYFGNVDGGVVGSGREGATESFYVYNTENLKAGTFNKYALTDTGQIGKLLTSVPNLDTRTRPWYIHATQKGAITWNDIYLLITGQDMTIALSSPVYDQQHNLLGVVSVEIFVSQIENFLETLKISETGQSFIMERSGLLVASSTGESSFIKNNDKMERLDARNSQSPMIKYAAEYLRERFGENYDVATDVQFDFEIHGKRYFANVAPVHDQYGIDWLIVVVIPESDFMAEITATNQSTFLITILALLISILASIFGAGRIASRISHLNKSTRAFTRGEGTGLFSANSRISEIDELANSFTEMEHQLTQTLNDLKSEVSERKTIGQALRESESLFRAIFEQAAVGVAQIETASGHFVRINQKYCDILGYSRAEMEKINFQTITHADDLEVDLANLELLKAGEIREFTMEKRYFRKSGETIWVSLTSSPMWMAGETPNYHIAIVQDITTRKQTETERQTLLEIMQGLVVTKDLHDFLGIIHHSIAKVIYAENFFVLLYNKDTGLFEEIYSVDRFDPPGAPSRLEKSISAYVFNSGQPYLMTQAHFDELAARGEVELVGTNSPSWLGVPLKASRETIGVMVVQDYDEPNRYTERDIDFLASIAGQVALVIERKQAEEALLESEERYRTLVETADDVILMTDLQGKHLFRNNAYCTSLGFDVGDDIELEGFARVHPDDQPAIRSGMNELFQKGEGSGEYRVLHKDGRWLHRYNKSKIIRDKAGQPQAILSIIRDVTERKQMQQNLFVNEARYRTLFEQSPDGIVILNPETAQLIEFNEQACRQLGYTRDEFGKLTLKDIEAIETIEESLAHIQMIIRDGYGDFDTRQRTKQGEVRDVHVAAKLIDASGLPIYHCIWRDITERKQTENLLVQIRQNYEIFFNTIDEFLFVLDEQGNIIHTNTTVIERLGYTSEELFGKSVLMLHPLERREEAGRIVAEMLSGVTEFCPVPIVTKSGIQIPVETRVSHGFWDGKPVIFGVTKDISNIQLSEEKFSKLFHLNPSACGLSDVVTRKYVELNEAFYTLLGFDKDEVIGKTASDLGILTPDALKSLSLKGDSNGSITNAEADLKAKNGDIKHVLLSAENINVQDKKYRFTIVHDITERVQADEALRASEEKYRYLIENNHDIIYTLSPDGFFIFVSPAWTALLGHQVDQVAGQPFQQFVHPDDLPGCMVFLRAVIGSGQRQEGIEYRVRHIDGSWRWHTTSAVPLMDEAGTVVGFNGIARDITARVQADEALRVSEERFRKAFAISPDSININRLQDGMYVTINNGFTQIMGYTSEECIGKTSVELNIWDRPQDRQTLVEGLTKRGEIVNLEARFRAKNGDIKYGLVSAAVLELNGVKHIISITRDITERKRMDAALRESETRFRHISAVTSDIAYSCHTDEDGCFSIDWMTGAASLITGYSIEEIMAQSCWRFLVINDDSAIFDENVIGLAPGSQDSCELRIRHKNGGVVWISSFAKCVSDPQTPGRLLLYGGLVDITERKQTEEALQKSESRLRSILDATPFPIALVDVQDNNIYFWSQSAIALFGHTAPTAPEWYQIAYPNPDYRRDVIERWKPMLEKARLTNQAVNTGEYRVTCRDGSVRICELYAAFLADSLIVTFNDITERKMADEKLRSSDEQYRILFNHLPIPAFTKDINGIYTSCNEENLKYWGTNPLGHTDAEVSQNEIALALHANDQRAIESGKMVITDELLKSTPLGDRLFITHKVPLRDGSGNIIGILGASLDITERKRADDDMLEKSKELEALFTISSHLRTAQTAGDMLPVVLAQMSQVLNADANAVILLNPNQTRFTFAICDGLLTSSAGLQFDVENSISGRVMQTRQPYVTLDYANDPLRSGVILDSAGIGTMVVVPLQSETEFTGALLCGRTKDSHTGTFTPAEVKLLVSIGEMVGTALRRARLYEDALLRLNRVKGLHSIDSYINANWDIKGALKLIVTQALSLMNVDAAVILYYDKNLHILEYASAQGFHYKAIEKTRFELNGAFSEKAILERRVIIASDLSEIQDPVHKEMMQKESLIACYITPMIAKGKVVGVLELYKRAPLHSNQEWLDFLESIGAQAAIAIDNARLFRDLQTSNFELVMAYDATIQGWSHALELRDRETEGHTLRVTETTVGIAKLAGLNEKEITRIRRGALLHDIGKMGVPDHILNKTGKLTSKEWEIIRQHPQYAYDMLLDIEFLRPALEIPYCHHEKWDGTGYPQGLQDLQIPYAARLFAVVDVWDALTNDRVYRKAWSKKKTIAHIKEQSGKHFDPQVVELFLKYMDALAERKK